MAGLPAVGPKHVVAGAVTTINFEPARRAFRTYLRQLPVWARAALARPTALYTGDLNGSSLTPVNLVVKIPGGGAPTGQVFNGTTGFVVHHGKQAGPAKFIFASETGAISGWNPTVGAKGSATSTRAQLAVSVPHAVY